MIVRPDDGINVVLQDMPCKIKGFVSRNEYGDFVIIINSRLNSYQQKAAYEHEMAHIHNGDFDSDKIVSFMESEAHCV